MYERLARLKGLYNSNRDIGFTKVPAIDTALGIKYDSNKPRPGLVLGGFSLAIQEVIKVGTFGANKYRDNGWVSVPNGISRYTDAMLRHYLAEQGGEVLDEESNLQHAAHLAWNALARLDLLLREKNVNPHRAA